MRFPVLVVFVGIVGCSSKTQIGPDGTLPDGGKVVQSAPGTGGTSGTRLKARTYNAEDGSQQFIGWFDSQRNENCGFQMAADGKIRCLPSGTSVEAGFFGDTGCTQPLATMQTGCAPPASYALADASDPGACEPRRFKVLTLGAKHAGDAYRGAPGSCIKNTLPVGTDLYDTGAEVPASSLVAATEGHE
jgi:hypothetical protein